MENSTVLVSQNPADNQLPQYQKDLSKSDEISSERGLGEKKEDFSNKLSDSACGSLNESEDSGSKCQENEPNLEDAEEEMDSLECDDENEFLESEEEEEESVDNNTFNVINTENSESQEISELTNDDSSSCDKTKENDMQGDSFIGVANEDSTGFKSVSGNVISESGSNNSPETGSVENSERSTENTKDDEEGDFDPSFEEDEESSKSRRSEDRTETSEDPAMEISTDSSDKIGTDKAPEKVSPVYTKMEKRFQSLSKGGLVRKEQNKPPGTNSPKSRKRLGLGLVPPLSKPNEFRIEIFESKRKPDITTLSENNLTKSTDQRPQTLQSKIVNNLNNIFKPNDPKEETELETSSEKLQIFNQVLLSEPRGSIPDVISSDSGDEAGRSRRGDARPAIREENEDSDALSPMRSLVEESQAVTPAEPSPGSHDISRKKPPTEPKSPQTPGLPQPKSTNAITTTTTNSNPTALPKTTTVTSPKTPPSSTPSDIAPSATGESSENGETEPGAPKPSPAETKKPIPMAFTIELDSAASDSSTSGNSTKKLDITASISQWAPKHRRNLSLTKVEEHKKVEERQGSEKPPLGRPRSGTVGAGTPLGSKRVGAGYHSEGYFSSDQDDEAPKRTDLKSPRSPRTPETSHPPPVLVRSNSQDSSKGNSIRKHGNKPQGRSCCKERERKPSVSELTGKSYKSDKKMGSDSKKQTKNSPTEEIDPSKDDKDDVSEAGTYTIDKDSPSPEEDQARNDINGVFGVPTESEAELTSTTATAVPASTTDNFQEDESSWMSASEIPPSISRNSPNWIQQWAAHVAEQTKPQLESVPSLPKSSVTSPRGHKLLMASHENDFRPRRKLPTPPSHMNAPSSGLSPRADPASFANHKQFWRDQTLNSDLTSDTEAYLRDTENLVSSLQARVDKTKEENSAFRNASFESHESGGDSDFDTSFSYPFNDDDRMVPSLKSKLKLTGLLPTSKNMPNPSSGMISPRRPEGGVVKDPKLKKSRGEVAARDPSYDMFAQKKEDRGLHSDSSSEASEPYKDLPRTNDKNLPLKYNRAFSLRRARLGCEDPVSTQSMDKKKISRPSSAGAAVSTRKAPLGSTKSYQSVDSPSVSSPRCCGFGSPRGIASPSQSVGSKGTPHSPSQSVGSKGTPHSPSQSVGSKGTPHSDNFDRTDGGRFSLRLARTGSSSISTVKSPSKNSLKKDQSSSKKNATRSNSTLSSKEVDFQNWKRRKNYDPMKAAAEGKKKQVEKLKNVQPPPLSAENQSPSPPGSLLRSASFHGTEGVLSNLRWTRKACNNHPQYTSEDDGPYSLEEEMGPHPSPHHGSPLHRSPTSPHQLCQSPARQLPPPRGRRPSLGHSDEGDPQYQSSLRKISLDESGSEGKRSPLNGGTRGAGNLVSGAGRPKTKMEALDNLVISTIHSLSVKVRSTSESLLQKLKSHFDEEGDRAALLEEVLSHLSESDQSLASGQTRSTSRELAGILRNLKKIEHALEVIDRVIIIGEEEYRDDDIDYVPTEWVEDCDY